MPAVRASGPCQISDPALQPNQPGQLEKHSLWAQHGLSIQKNLPSASSGAEPEKPRAQSDLCLHAQVKSSKEIGHKLCSPVRKSVTNYQNKAVGESQRRQIAACGHGPLHCTERWLSHIIQNDMLLLHCYDSQAAAWLVRLQEPI